MRLALPVPFPRSARVATEIAPAVERPPLRPGRTIVKKRGWLAPLLQPVGVA